MQNGNTNEFGKRRRGRPPLETSNNTNKATAKSSSVTLTGHAAIVPSAVASSNQTTNLFLGTKDRSWMRPSPGDGLPHGLNSMPAPHTAASNPRTQSVLITLPHTVDRNHLPLSKVAPSNTAFPAAVDKPLPDYRFISIAPTTPPEDNDEHTQLVAGGLFQQMSEQEQAEEVREEQSHSRGRDDDARNELSSTERAAPTSSNNIAVTEANTTSQAVEIVDLTASQESGPADHGPPGHRPCAPEVRSYTTTNRDENFMSADELDDLTLYNALLADRNVQRESNVDSAPEVRRNTVPGLGVSSGAAPTTASMHRHNMEIVSDLPDLANTGSMTGLSASPQLLTPAASPNLLTQHLLRKRSLPQSVAAQQSQVRLRRDSPATVLPLQQFWPSTAAQRIPSQLTSSQLPGLPSGKGKMYIGTFLSHIAEIKQTTCLPAVADHARLPWLREACETDDLFFLLLSQMLCLHMVQPSILAECGLNNNSDAGFVVLQRFFGFNKDLPDVLLAFLAGWPDPPYMLKASKELSQWVSNINHVLCRLGPSWPEFHARCLTRKYPPTAQEISHFFGFHSVVLQRGMFRYLQKQILPRAPQSLHTEIYSLFIQDQIHYFTNSTVESVVDRLRIFASTYHQRLAEHWRRRRSNHPVGVDVFPTNTQTGFTSTPAGVQSSTPALPSPQQNASTLSRSLQNATPDVQPSNNTINPVTARTTGTLSSYHHEPVTHLSVPQRQLQEAGSLMPLQTLVSNTSTLPRPQVNGIGPIQNNYIVTHGPTATRQHRSPTAPLNTTTTSTRSQTQVLRSNMPPYAPQLLIPSLQNLPPYLADAQPEQEAMHQAHLNQPLTVIKDADMEETPRLYQFIERCALSPKKWRSEVKFLAYSFELSPDLIQAKANIIQPPGNSYKLLKRNIGSDSILFNLRCTKLDKSDGTLDVSDWAALTTYWPQGIFLSLNDQQLEIRRKRQHRRDLPIDVTELIKEGTNRVTVSIVGVGTEDEDKTFGLAVEIIGFGNHSGVMSMPGHVAAEQCLKNITNSMQPDTNTNEDDMIIVNDNMTVSISDPWLSRMWTIPVRGKKCKHWECFDLQTLLETRKSDCKDALTSVYHWECPVGGCGKDVRPQNLVIDGFMQQVRTKLIQAGKTEAKSINIKNDGSWEIKEETHNEPNRSGSSPLGKNEVAVDARGCKRSTPQQEQSGHGASNTQTSARASARVIEIIDLDD